MKKLLLLLIVALFLAAKADKPKKVRAFYKVTRCEVISTTQGVIHANKHCK